MMKTLVMIVVLGLAVGVVAQGVPEQTGEAPAPSQTPAQGAGSQQKTITNPAEYNSYLNAIQQTDLKAKAIALEGFVQQYPNSVVREDALQLLMAAYQQLGNSQKVVDTAHRLLQVNPNNLRALALLAYLQRQQAEAGGPQSQQALADAQQYARRGLQAENAPKPEGMSDADYQKLRAETTTIFQGVAGMAALQNKNYPQAQQMLTQAVKANPNDLTNVYPLALAYLQAQPPDYLNGLWYIARATDLSAQNPTTQQQISRFGQSAYTNYHGSSQGWDQLVQQAAASPTPPPGFTIQPAPSPAEVAASLAQKPVDQLNFDDFRTVFTSGNQPAATTVWNQLKDKPIAFEAKVLGATPNQLTLSASGQDIASNTPDVVLSMAERIPARLQPKVGGTTQVVGTPVRYASQPYMITMNQGSFYKAAPTAPTHGRSTGQ